MSKKNLLILIAIVLVLIAAWQVWSRLNATDDSAQTEEKIPVEVSPVKLGEVVQSLTYNGDIEAEFEVKVFSKFPDRIEFFFVDEGQYIKKGSPIAGILATTMEQAVKQAEAGFAAARSQEANLKLDFERAQRLAKENAMSQQQYDAIKTQYDAVQAQMQQAEAALASVKSQLDDATITAPIAGIIGKRYYDPGDVANPGLPLVSIVQMDRVKISFNATELDLGKLKTGQTVNVKVKAYPDQKFLGTISKISPILDPMTRMAEIEVMVSNSEKLLKPGMYAIAEVITGILKNVRVVPRIAAIESTTMERIDGEDIVVKNFYVYVADGDHAVQKKLDIQYVNHRVLAVNSGIEVGDQLVVSGQNNLRDGVAVSVISPEVR
jgi:RND family efflux transporter MFP subunit